MPTLVGWEPYLTGDIILLISADNVDDQGAGGAGVQDDGDVHGQDRARQPQSYCSIQPRCEGAEGHLQGGAAQRKSLCQLGGIYQVR